MGDRVENTESGVALALRWQDSAVRAFCLTWSSYLSCWISRSFTLLRSCSASNSEVSLSKKNKSRSKWGICHDGNHSHLSLFKEANQPTFEINFTYVQLFWVRKGRARERSWNPCHPNLCQLSHVHATFLAENSILTTVHHMFEIATKISAEGLEVPSLSHSKMHVALK
jgi:hypothetical protein